MFGSTILDVALGLVFVYFLLSVIASQINEIVAGKLQWRSKGLEGSIRQLLSNPNLANDVLKHPLIQGLASKAPSYIPPNTFALAVFDTIVPGGNSPKAIDQVRDSVKALPETSAKKALLSIIDAADNDMTKARKGVEDWFNAAMDRLSGEYKRKIRWLTFGIALAVTLVLGADSIAIVNELWHEPGVRAAISTAAQAQITSAQSQPSTAQTQPPQDWQAAFNKLSQFPIGWSQLPGTFGGWAQKILGLLLTTLAVSLGAPFWFDLLNKLVNLRSSGPAPAPATTEAEKQPEPMPPARV
jgi:hypothetical protein